MTDILVDMFSEKYPPIGPHKVPRVSTYMGIERVHLKLLEKIFLEITEPLIEIKEIKTLADKIFDDISFRFYEKSEENGPFIFFDPVGIDDYVQRYMGHHIIVHEPFRYPYITISTGNRGTPVLSSRQRKKYFQFVNNLYDIFMERAKAI